ncbi:MULTISPECIES: GNAT family N-acetyltransferase [unclassified Herbaspirillum]|uniref:GNAT family N-acetyltransferase n=1 Tax=unclassified Herbaspirillum TaxID=2624150 RepID=UPI0011503324|nr:MULTISPECIES: N-acetyltransferase [unclassified Herbaspirillum]MBB5390062.1 putative N-acetyltransferase YhbS [Herbaspirillum sp. SJZ102]TQK09437.1 putative acetyltransferase [Herbaspirillum sp. SJZ130]TQK13876.1 putative acetyltransferase [Herbaspirillum sp. SJZ106]
MRDEIKIRPEEHSDIGAIRDVTEAAFRHAAYSSHTEHWIVDALRRSNQLSISLVAELDGNIVGHVAISPVSIAAGVAGVTGVAGWYGLGPISILPGHQGKGIGSALMREALSELKASNAQGCVVLGDPNYYGRFGFRVHEGLFYPGVPPEYFQALALNGGMPTGEVAYHDAFNATE